MQWIIHTEEVEESRRVIDTQAVHGVNWCVFVPLHAYIMFQRRLTNPTMQTKSGFKTRKRSKKNIYVATARPRSMNMKATKKMKKKREKKKKKN